MFLWFIATSVLTIFLVFTDPMFDYRPLVLGALLPDVIDAPFGGAKVMHSLVGAVGLLALAMAVSVGRRPLRKRLLAVPIGVLLHIVFDGAFTNKNVFWWPFTGGFDGARLPIAERTLVLNLALEAAGAAMLWWSSRAFGLADRDRRRQLVRTGRLTRVA
ncbi:MAG: hypothetical protein JWN99_1865 [Ilumatobacteraceae bacterium]|nr:hypothetical protein [Ilumatobacteraceae bacterium]